MGTLTTRCAGARATRGSAVWTQTLALGVALAAVCGLAPADARSESSLSLVNPGVFETVPAATFDAGSHRVGPAHLVIEKLDNGNVRLFSESGVDGGARTVATAELTPIDGGRLRPITQQSRSFDSSGKPMGVLSIDHTSAKATCTHPLGNDGEVKVETLDLPDADRVANVPLNLLFDPLVRGETSKISFQILLCRHGPRLMDFQASVVRREDNGKGHLVEVRYGPDFGAVVSLLAKTMVPKLSFWFDPSARNPWLGHRMPLYSEGPDVLVVRKGVSAAWLID